MSHRILRRWFSNESCIAPRASWSTATTRLKLASSRVIEVEYGSLKIPGSSPNLPVVVALHCSGSSYKQWDALGRELCGCPQLASKLIAPNLFGSGRTGAWPNERPLTLDDQAFLVAACVGDAECYVVGHSHGGSVATRYATICEESRGLILFEPNSFFLLEAAQKFHLADLDAWLDGLAVIERIRLAVEASRRDEWGRLFWDFWLKRDDDADWDTLEAQDKAKFFKATSRHISHEITSILLARDFSTARDLNTVQALGGKVHLVVSPQPGLGAHRYLNQLATLFAKLKCPVHTAPEGGHLGPISHPEPTARLLAQCLQSVSSASDG